MSVPSKITTSDLDTFMIRLRERNPGQKEFHQAVEEVMGTLLPFVAERPEYGEARILERLTEPDRVISFRVTWEDDDRNVRVNRAWRVQFNNAIGPYKGGLRFDKSVNESILKFLGFEQVLKNSLTGLPMGGAKGGSNFNPKGKSDSEIMRFCHSLMTELARHIGEDVDVPAGDIGVGGREISYLFGQYKRMENRWAGILTGKGLAFGGSQIRAEATGYGAVYFARHMLHRKNEDLAGKVAGVSGSGNVAQYCLQKLIELGAKPVTASDSDGCIYDPDGIDEEKLAWIIDLKEKRRGRIAEYAEKFGCEYLKGGSPWRLKLDLAFPCATQNELDGEDAKALIDNGILAVSEGANMPSTNEAIDRFRAARIAFGPGKAANAGGVAVSGLEQSQNALRIAWKRDEVDERLKGIMAEIHDKCVRYGESDNGYVDYVKGANIGGFVRVAEAMLAYGYV